MRARSVHGASEQGCAILANRRWRISGGLSVALGAAVLFGWHAGIATILQVHPSFAPMQYNTALCFLLCGLGVLFLDRRPRLTAILAFLVVLISFLTLVEYCFGVDWTIDQIIMKSYITVQTSHPGRMAPNAGLGFVITGAILLVSVATKGRAVRTIGILALVVVVLGCVALIGYSTDLKPAYGWGGLTSMAILAALGFVILGVGLFAFAWVRGLYEYSVTAMTTMFGAGATIVLWHVTVLHYALDDALINHAYGDTLGTNMQGTTLLVAVAGMLGTSAVWLVIRQLRKNADLLERRVADRTRELDSQKLALDEHLIVAITDPSGKITHANDNFCRISKYTRAELIGQDHRIVNSGHHPREFFANLWKEIAGGNVWHGEICNRAQDGSPYWVDTTIVPFKDDAGRITQYVAIRTDITERKLAEGKLIESEDRFRRAIVDAPFPVMLHADDGEVIAINKVWTEITGYAHEDIPTLAEWTKLAYGNQHRATQARIEAVYALDVRKEEEEYTILTRHGDTVVWDFSTTPLGTLADGRRLVMSVAKDVTERKWHERQLLAATRAAESANLAKSEFLANMSHEIRTPMTAILGFAENMLDADESDSEKLNCVHTIRRNGEYLLGLINDILDLSKIEAGQMPTESRDCQPCRIIAEVGALMRVRADAKGLPLHIEYEGAIPKTIRTDPTRLRQILINLIGNAIKFTEAGSVRVVTRFIDGRDKLDQHSPSAPTFFDLVADSVDLGDGNSLQFDVIDTGRGLTELQRAKLFQPFMQADTSTTRTLGGTGLGLTISKKLAKLLDGDVIIVATKLGAGSTFRATVATGPLNGTEMLDDPMSATIVATDTIVDSGDRQADLKGCHILLAEDGPDNQRLISFVLKKAGARVTIEENGKLALDAALAAMDEGNPFDVILMDMQMPVMDGYEATSLLRQRGYSAPIIAVTAHAMDGDREECIDVGCDDYATKPIDRKKLIALIKTHTSSANVAVPTPGSTPAMVDHDETSASTR